jgi:single-stranded-DNA-specific exonuclease
MSAVFSSDLLKPRPRREACERRLQQEGLSALLARLYGARGVESVAELDYSLSQLLRPDSLHGLPKALDLLVELRDAQARLLILGDFDADGATSTALAVRGLRALGYQQVDFLVPNRFEYGYGLTPEIVEAARPFAPDCLITVDNGISSVDGVAAAKALGWQVLVTDHHLPGDHLPAADAIVNPNQPGCAFEAKSLAGVGVMFYVLLALRQRLTASGRLAAPGPNLAQFLDLVALGTVADVVPLERNNRILVQQGLQRIRAGQACAGIAAIAQVAGRALTKMQAQDLGFVIGPRLNAAGRLDDMTLGIRCLLSDDPAEALQLAAQLDALNRERRTIEASMQKDADHHLLALPALSDLPAGLCLYQPDWHQGVIGILASRLKDRYHRPVIVLAEAGDGWLKGSGRSIVGVHLRDLLDFIAKRHPGLITKFGGHAMAAGLSLPETHWQTFASAFAEAVTDWVGEAGLRPEIATDGSLTPADFTLDQAQAIAEAGPWGQAFPEPAFDGEFYLSWPKILGGKHLKCLLAPVQSPASWLEAIAFNIDVESWQRQPLERIKALYQLQINDFQGRQTVQLLILKWWPAE